MFTKSLTIVLPVHNAESRLRKNVRELLELASELTSRFGVLIIDDGSTDATFDVAEELASYFPQVRVLHHRECLGLGASLEYVRRRVRSDAVIVHDGVTPINSQQVRTLWRQWLEERQSPDGKRIAAIDLSDLQAIHASLARVHRQAIGFQLVSAPQGDGAMTADAPPAGQLPRTDSSHTRTRTGVGRIPSPPRPKFLTALAEFALGE